MSRYCLLAKGKPYLKELNEVCNDLKPEFEKNYIDLYAFKQGWRAEKEDEDPNVERGHYREWRNRDIGWEKYWGKKIIEGKPFRLITTYNPKYKKDTP